MFAHHLLQGLPECGHGVFGIAQPRQQLVPLVPLGPRLGERGVALVKLGAELADSPFQLDVAALVDLLPEAALNFRLEPVSLVADSP